MVRERVGLLLDRATRAMSGRVGLSRQRVERLAGRLSPTLPVRLARDRARLGRSDVMDPLAVRRLARGRAMLGSAEAALAVLGPQATLERGYAIVRRASDGSIVRDPADAPPGSKLALRVARGELPASADPR
jgi:exodeoxyribonuclease VII large subunit